MTRPPKMRGPSSFGAWPRKRFTSIRSSASVSTRLLLFDIPPAPLAAGRAALSAPAQDGQGGDRGGQSLGSRASALSRRSPSRGRALRSRARCGGGAVVGQRVVVAGVPARIDLRLGRRPLAGPGG